ncbi:thiamine pyrophosphokinase [Coleophoma crateriformis]|uniref:Thiamine pyrophosphokinase n=1 Tax=Coleophoma crateriformis TaxID=565419 RepID=A0A3D8SHQ3_9HELO|nr:thiamine pyrophosphokinase [Coleophoma crateriformis]
MNTNLNIVKECDKWLGVALEYETQIASLWKFFLPDDPRPHGFLLDSVVDAMPWTTSFCLNASKKEVHLLKGNRDHWQAACNEAIDEILDLAREKGSFPKLGRKRDEKFPIVGANFSIAIERSASSLFGIIGQGVHMTVYTSTPTGLRFWIPQRNLNKSTYPGMLDNAVAGGVAAGEMPMECLIREAEEEAAISRDMVSKNARAAGTVTWFNISNEMAGGQPGLMNPGVLYVYDLEVGPDLVLKPVDNDVHAFHLMDLKQVQEAMKERRFKPASASVMMDFLIRHGLITAESDTDYAEIVSRLHRKLPFSTNPMR